MQTRTQIYTLLALIIIIILASCTLKSDAGTETPPTPTTADVPEFEWRDPNPVTFSPGEPYFDQAIPLVEPALCLDNVTLEDVLRNADDSMTLLFRNGTGEISEGKYVAAIEGREQLYTCEVNAEEKDLLACTGPDIPAGSEISVHFGEVSGGAFENLAGNSTRINLSELWKSNQTNLTGKFDFQLAGETAAFFGSPTPQNLGDAYALITAAASLNVNEAITGGGWGAPAWLLLSSLPQYQKTGLPCNGYWECAKACANEINYDLRSEDLVGAFDFYKNYASKLGGLLPDTCQAFNTFANALTPRPGTPQYLEYQWQVVTSDRLELYDPQEQLFDLYGSRNWEPRGIPTAIDVIPNDILQCAAENGWPYGEITDLEAFLNWYFNTLFGYSGEGEVVSQAGGWIYYGNFTQYCTSDQSRAWIELATNEISGSSEYTISSYFDSLLDACVVLSNYDVYSWPNEFGEDDIPEFLAWLFDLWSRSPESIPSPCAAYLASDEFENQYGALRVELYSGESICTFEQEYAINSARVQFQNRYASCGIAEEEACFEYNAACQEDAFVASLVNSGRIGGPPTCFVEGPSDICLGDNGENPFVPPGVWECALDTCDAARYPLQRGEGVYGLSLYLYTEYQEGGNQLPASCMTAEVGQWVWQNYDCASENYADDSYDYSSCGLPYQDRSFGNCFALPTDYGYITYCLTEPDDQYCPSCSTVYQCADGEEGIFCNESPEGEDPGYWGQLNQCGQQIEWEGDIQTYQDASDLIQYLITAAPFLKAEDIPATCKVSVEQTLLPGLPFGEFLTKLTIGGKVEGSTLCSQAKLFTIPEEPTVDRCAEFNPSQYRLNILDIPYNSNLVTLYLTMPGGVPGLEREVPEDSRPWEYAGVLGDVQAESCGFYDYTNRLYCSFVVPQTYMETVRPLQISVNGCDVPFYSHPLVSIIPLEPPQNGGTTACVQPPDPDPQNSCWNWDQEECKWVCIN